MTLITRRHSLALLASLPATPALAEAYYLDSQGLALRGFDVVAYFLEENAVEGSRSYEYEWDTALWRFERQESLDEFRKNPDKYQPQYGGYCAEGIARGFKRQSDPTVWVLVNGKLYFHYTVEAQNRWAEDIRGHIRMADKNWPNLRDLRY